MEKFYITTPIYYVNDEPHLGHAYTTIAADLIARWHRKLNKEVFFLTGTDENGQKIEESALNQNKRPEDFVDEKVYLYKKNWKNLNISYDFFIRTTDTYHRIFVKNFIKKVYENGDIYKGIYNGYYCVSCEQYYTQTEVPNLICPIHKKPLVEMDEETYFFKLSKYQDKLLEFYEKNPDFIQPKKRANEIINRVKEGLKDISITRKNVKWGIPFPYDESHTVYVWFDALTNYLSSLVANGLQSFWPADLHLVGKEILWFHSVIWPAMLMSAGYELPQKVFAHGWWTVEEEKMSKTKGNVVKPLEIIDKIGADSLRFYLFKVPFGEDINFSYEDLVKYHNNELANELGNLVTRVVSMAHKYSHGEIKLYEITNEEDINFIKGVDIFEDVKKEFENLNLSEALSKIFSIIKKTNSYLNKVEPWKIEDKKRLTEVLGLFISTIKYIAEYIEPFLPTTAKKISKIINLKLDNNLKLEIYKHIKVNETENLFEKVELSIFDNYISKNTNIISSTNKYKITKTENDKKVKSSKKEHKINNLTENNNNFKEAKEKNIVNFSNLSLQVGKIIEIKEHLNADKLFIEKIDIGDRTLQIVSGLKDYYKKEELLNKNVIVLTNLEPAKFRNELSEGMILATEDDKDVGILYVKDRVKLGTFISAGDEIANNDKIISIKKFSKIKLISNGKDVLYNKNKLKAGRCVVKVDKNIKGEIR